MLLELPSLPDDPERLEQQIEEEEQSVKNLHPDTRAHIQWADPRKKHRTEYSLIYLHGFTASHGEGAPVHRNVAKRFGLNLFLGRLAGHGIKDENTFQTLTPEALIESALKAVAIGKKLGNKVIVMGTSTGASLALYLASRIKEPFWGGLILFSPLIDFYGIKSFLLTHGWMRSILRFTLGDDFIVRSRIGSPRQSTIWYSKYRLNGALALGEFIESTMTDETFSRIELPVFTGYYYKSRSKQDNVVSVPAIRRMFEQLSTPADKKEIISFPGAGTHVIGCGLVSKSIGEVQRECFRFSENVLGLNPLR